MKHLKTYENTINENALKKYCIWNVPRSDMYDDEDAENDIESNINSYIYEIIEIIGSKKNKNEIEYKSITLYYYNSKTKKLYKPEKPTLEIYPAGESIYTEDIETCIKFTSDNLQECIDVIDVICDINKFNL